MNIAGRIFCVFVNSNVTVLEERQILQFLVKIYVMKGNCAFIETTVFQIYNNILYNSTIFRVWSFPIMCQHTYILYNVLSLLSIGNNIVSGLHKILCKQHRTDGTESSTCTSVDYRLLEATESAGGSKVSWDEQTY